MTAKDLLYKILDYNYLWSLPNRIHSKPAMVRLSQIESLQNAFGLSKEYISPITQIKYAIVGDKHKLKRAQHLSNLTNLEYLLRGYFLYVRQEEANKELSEKVKTTLTSIDPGMAKHINENPVDIKWLFDSLLHFRQEVYKLTYPNEGMLEGYSSGLHYSFYLQRRLKKTIQDNLSEMDETLWLILDPEKREISKEKINYPDVDLSSIDLEWSRRNYD